MLKEMWWQHQWFLTQAVRNNNDNLIIYWIYIAFSPGPACLGAPNSKNVTVENCTETVRKSTPVKLRKNKSRLIDKKVHEHHNTVNTKKKKTQCNLGFKKTLCVQFKNMWWQIDPYVRCCWLKAWFPKVPNDIMLLLIWNTTHRKTTQSQQMAMHTH